MRILIDFRDALVEFADTLGVHHLDTDSMWYVADLFELLVVAALDYNKGYKEAMDGLISKLQNETGESRASCQSACDLAVNQILVKMDEVFAQIRHVEIYKTRKDISRALSNGMSAYLITIPDDVTSYI